MAARGFGIVAVRAKFLLEFVGMVVWLQGGLGRMEFAIIAPCYCCEQAVVFDCLADFMVQGFGEIEFLLPVVWLKNFSLFLKICCFSRPCMRVTLKSYYTSPTGIAGLLLHAVEQKGRQLFFEDIFAVKKFGAGEQ